MGYFRLTIPKTVAITNPRINGVYYALMLAMVLFSIWNFFESKQFYAKISAEIQTFVIVEGESKANALRLNVTTHRLCPPEKRYTSHMQQPDPAVVPGLPLVTWIEDEPRKTWIQVSSTCLPMCSNGTDDEDRRTCVSSLTFAHQRNSQEVALWSARHVLRKDGTYVDSLLGLSVMGSVFRFHYIYTLERAVPMLSRWLNSVQDDTGNETTAQTVLLDSGGRPSKFFPPGSRVVLSIQDVLAAVHGFPAHLNVANGEVPWEVFRDGLELTGHVECYNDAGTLHRVADGKLDSLSIGREPICLLTLSYSRCCADMDSWFQDADRNTIVDRAVTLRTRSTTSNMKFVDTSKIVVSFTSILVLLALPMKFMRWFITTFLGQLSTLYGRVLEHVFDIQRETATMAILLMSNSVAFLELTDVECDKSQLPGISRERMTERMQQVMRQRRQDLDDNEVAAFVDCCYMSLLQDKGDDSTFNKFGQKLLPWHKRCTVDKGMKEMIDIDTFNGHCSFHSPVNLEAAVRLFDKDRQRLWLERIFTPRGVNRALRKVHSFSSKKDAFADEDSRRVSVRFVHDAVSERSTGRSIDSYSTCLSPRSESTTSVDHGKSEGGRTVESSGGTRITKKLTLEAQKKVETARLRQTTKTIEELARRLDMLEANHQQLGNKTEDLMANVDQQTQAGAKSFAALDDRVAKFEAGMLDMEQKYKEHFSFQDRSLHDLFRQVIALDARLKELPPLEVADTCNRGAAACYLGAGAQSGYREHTGLPPSKAGDQQLQQGNKRCQHLESVAVEARLMPLEDACQVSLEEALVLKHVKPLAAKLEQQRLSFESLVACLNGCLDEQQQAEPRKMYSVAEENSESRWQPDGIQGQCADNDDARVWPIQKQHGTFEEPSAPPRCSDRPQRETPASDVAKQHLLPHFGPRNTRPATCLKASRYSCMFG